MLEKKIKLGNLFIFYGQLLTEKQQEILNLYYLNDLSLGEISEILYISRQAVYDTIKKSEKLLEEYEEKLGLVKKFTKTKNDINKLVYSIDKLIIELNDLNTDFLLKEMNKIKEMALDILDEY